jgi:predicted MFS family arabinose efflux permease
MTLIPARYKVLSAGIFSLVLVMGVARFSYTPLLPLMQQQAGLGVAEAGWLAAINYLGYLSGAVLASLIGDVVLKDRLYRLGMIVAVLTTTMMGMTTNAWIWAVSRYFAGLSTAAGMLFGTGLILNWLIRHDYRSELGIHFSGVGLGIAGSAAAVMLMNRWQLDWRAQWYAFAAFGCVLLMPALGWLPAPDRSAVTHSGQAMRDSPPSPVFLRIFMAAYFCAGVGYVVSATFIVAIVDHLPGFGGQGTLVFLFLGLGAAPASAAWDFVARRTGELNALLLAAVLQIAGILLPVLGERAFHSAVRRRSFWRIRYWHGEPGTDHSRPILPDAAGEDDGKNDAVVRHCAGDRACRDRLGGAAPGRISGWSVSGGGGDGRRGIAAAIASCGGASKCVWTRAGPHVATAMCLFDAANSLA